MSNKNDINTKNNDEDEIIEEFGCGTCNKYCSFWSWECCCSERSYPKFQANDSACDKNTGLITTNYVYVGETNDGCAGAGCYTGNRDPQATTRTCSVNCEYNWPDWSTLPVNKNNGTQTRTVNITLTAKNGGACPVSVGQTETRNVPVNCEVGGWSNVGTCTALKGINNQSQNGFQNQQRSITINQRDSNGNIINNQCSFPLTQALNCKVDCQPVWNPWTYNYQTGIRTRTLDNDNTIFPSQNNPVGAACPQKQEEPFAVDCQVGDWYNVPGSTCTSVAGKNNQSQNGYQTQKRDIIQHQRDSTGKIIDNQCKYINELSKNIDCKIDCQPVWNQWTFNEDKGIKSRSLNENLTTYPSINIPGEACPAPRQEEFYPVNCKVDDWVNVPFNFKKEIFTINDGGLEKGLLYTRDEAKTICENFGAVLATKEQVAQAQKNGADWCLPGHTLDGPYAVYPVNTSAGSNCGNGLSGLQENKNIKANNKAAPICYGQKPILGDETILPFNQSRYSVYDPVPVKKVYKLQTNFNDIYGKTGDIIIFEGTTCPGGITFNKMTNLTEMNDDPPPRGTRGKNAVFTTTNKDDNWLSNYIGKCSKTGLGNLLKDKFGDAPFDLCSKVPGANNTQNGQKLQIRNITTHQRNTKGLTAQCTLQLDSDFVGKKGDIIKFEGNTCEGGTIYNKMTNLSNNTSWSTDGKDDTWQGNYIGKCTNTGLGKLLKDKFGDSCITIPSADASLISSNEIVDSQCKFNTEQSIPCDVDCQEAWAPWQHNLRTGIKTRILDQNNTIFPSGNGKQCQTKQEELFNVDCVMSEWDPWSKCNSDTGTQFRNRTIKQEPKNNGKKCDTTFEQQDCAIDCVVYEEDWQPWACDTSIGKKVRVRTPRVYPLNGGKQCPPLTEEQDCARDCQVGPWGDWSVNRAIGVKTRLRSITVPPKKGGVECLPLQEEEQFPIDCEVTEWTPWKENKNTGIKTRARTITQPQVNWGKKCPPLQEETTFPVDCLPVEEWEGWTYNKRTGIKTRTKKKKYIARNGGKECTPNQLKQEEKFDVDCITSEWTEWSSCDPNTGVHARTREIIQEPKNNGKKCGELNQSENCPVDCVTSPNDWQPWACDSTTGLAVRVRTPRVYPMNGGKACVLTEEEECNRDCQVGSWSDWTIDNKLGIKTRTRKVTVPSKKLGNQCPPLVEEEKFGIDCTVSEWTPFKCDDNTGVSTRTRSIVQPQVNMGKSCPPLTETKPCDVDCVPEDDSKWSPWSCDKSTGISTRDRPIKIQKRNNGKDCNLSDLHQIKNCDVDCIQSEWSEWSPCDPNTATKERTRRTIQESKNNGKKCGPTNEKESCPIDCVVSDSDWQPWICNQSIGMATRTREPRIYPTPDGKQCPALVEEEKCTSNQPVLRKDLENVNCVLGTWTPWNCDTKTGKATRTRVGDTPPINNGEECPPTQEIKDCAFDCVMGQWQNGTCDNKTGVMNKTRKIIKKDRLGGKPCGAETEEVTCDVDCIVSDFDKDWKCNYDTGVAAISRKIIQQPRGNGQKCPPLTATQNCSFITPPLPPVPQKIKEEQQQKKFQEEITISASPIKEAAKILQNVAQYQEEQVFETTPTFIPSQFSYLGDEQINDALNSYDNLQQVTNPSEIPSARQDTTDKMNTVIGLYKINTNVPPPMEEKVADIANKLADLKTEQATIQYETTSKITEPNEYNRAKNNATKLIQEAIEMQQFANDLNQKLNRGGVCYTNRIEKMKENEAIKAYNYAKSLTGNKRIEAEKIAINKINDVNAYMAKIRGKKPPPLIKSLFPSQKNKPELECKVKPTKKQDSTNFFNLDINKINNKVKSITNFIFNKLF